MIRKIKFPEQQYDVRALEYSDCTERRVDSKRKHTMQLQNFISKHRTTLLQIFLFSLAICVVAVFILFILYTFGPVITLIAGFTVLSVYIAGASDS